MKLKEQILKLRNCDKKEMLIWAKNYAKIVIKNIIRTKTITGLVVLIEVSGVALCGGVVGNKNFKVLVANFKSIWVRKMKMKMTDKEKFITVKFGARFVRKLGTKPKNVIKIQT
jgi:hypothetical protein